MKVSCGTDIIEIERIKESIEKLGDAFLNKVYTKNEIAYSEGRGKMKYQHYAGRFAAKEAIFKAVSGLLNGQTMNFTDAEVLNDESRKPRVTLLNNVKLEKIIDISISISHCREYAVANVVVLMEE